MTKVCWIAPCIGIGGADMFMLSMSQNWQNVEVTGFAIGDHATRRQVELARKFTNAPIWQMDHGNEQHASINYDKQFENCVWHAARGADIVISWCMPKIANHFLTFDLPVVELAQNSDGYAAEICESNDSVVDYRVAVSRAAVQAFPENRRDDVQIIYNGVDPNHVVPRLGRDTMRKGLGLPEDGNLIVYIGRLVEEKNPQAVIQALAGLPPNWYGLFVGGGYNDLTVQKEAQRWAPNRTFFAPQASHVGDILAAADVFLLGSDFEGLPLAAIEAWMAGVPTVVSDIDPYREIEEQCGSEITWKVPLRAEKQALVEACWAATQTDMMSAKRVNLAREVAWQYLNTTAIGHQWELFLADCVCDYAKSHSTLQVFQAGPHEPKKNAKAFVRYIEHG